MIGDAQRERTPRRFNKGREGAANSLRTIMALQGTIMTSTTTKPTRAALSGVLLVLPFVSMNTIVANRLEPFFSLIRPGIHTSLFEYVLLVATGHESLPPSRRRDCLQHRSHCLTNF